MASCFLEALKERVKRIIQRGGVGRLNRWVSGLMGGWVEESMDMVAGWVGWLGMGRSEKKVVRIELFSCLFDMGGS